MFTKKSLIWSEKKIANFWVAIFVVELLVLNVASYADIKSKFPKPQAAQLSRINEAKPYSDHFKHLVSSLESVLKPQERVNEILNFKRQLSRLPKSADPEDKVYGMVFMIGYMFATDPPPSKADEQECASLNGTLRFLQHEIEIENFTPEGKDMKRILDGFCRGMPQK